MTNTNLPRITGRRAQTEHYETALDLSANASSEAVDTLSASNGSITLIWTGLDAADGMFVVEGSDDQTNWATVDNSSCTADVTPDSILYDILHIGYQYIRVRWVAGSVTAGTATVRTTLKVGGR